MTPFVQDFDCVCRRHPGHLSDRHKVGISAQIPRVFHHDFFSSGFHVISSDATRLSALDAAAEHGGYHFGRVTSDGVSSPHESAYRQGPYRLMAGDGPRFHEEATLDAGVDILRGDEGLIQSIDELHGSVVGVGLAMPDGAPLSSASSSLVLLFSSIVAVLGLVCIVLAFYIGKRILSCMLCSSKAWELLPRFQKPVTCITQPDLFQGGKSFFKAVGQSQPGALMQNYILVNSHVIDERCGLHVEKENYLDVSDADSDLDGTDAYQDALDVTPLLTMHDLPSSDVEAFMDPPFPVMQHTSAPFPHIPPRPALADASLQVASDPESQAVVHSRRRAYRSELPEFDFVLALQLHPGLGMNADSAWVVRFLVTIFGWFAVGLSRTH